jgi:WD40 repeat protein
MWVASGVNSSERRKAGVWVLESSALRQYAQSRDDNFGVDVSAQEAWASDSGAVTSLAFSATRPLLMIGTFLGEIFQFNLQTGEKTSIRTIPSAQPVAEMVFTPNNILLAADASGGFFAWDDQNFAILVDPLCMKSGRGAVHLAFSARQNLLVAGYAGGDLVFWTWDNTQRVFNCADQNMNKLNIAGSITSVVFNPSQNILAWSSDRDDLVYLWEMTPGVQPVSIPVNDPTNLAFSPDGTLLAVGHNVSNEARGVMRVYDVRNLQTPGLIKEWDDSKDRHNETINGVVFSPDGSFFASGGNADVRLWSIVN